MRKIIQIIKSDSITDRGSIIALCDDGTIWISYNEWKPSKNPNYITYDAIITWKEYDTTGINLNSACS